MSTAIEIVALRDDGGADRVVFRRQSRAGAQRAANRRSLLALRRGARAVYTAQHEADGEPRVDVVTPGVGGYTPDIRQWASNRRPRFSGGTVGSGLVAAPGSFRR